MGDGDEKKRDLPSEGSFTSIGTVTDIGIGGDDLLDETRSVMSRIVVGEIKKSVSCSILEGIMDHKSALSCYGIDDEKSEEVGCCYKMCSRRQQRPRYQKFLEYILAHIRHGTDRETWSNQTEFVLSLIGYAVGLGNIWRFPYLAYKNGGGAFLVPYIIMLIVAGLPLFLFELALGQFASLGMLSIWKICPFFKGVGISMMMITTLICIYYNVIIMYAVYYMFVSIVSLESGLPWKNCRNSWNTEWCVEHRKGDRNATLDVIKKHCPEKLNASNTDEAAKNLSFCGYINFTTAAQEYWTNVVLRLPESNGIGDLGPLSMKNTIFLFFSWIIIYFCMRKGVKSSGKVVYFTSTFPYILLIVFLIRGVTLDGYMEGIKFYIIPKWEKILNIGVWAEAATQIFYSLGIAFGSLINMASYNKFNNNFYRHAMTVALVNCGTSIFGGFVIFSFVGYMAHVTGRPVESVVQGGSGLVFIAYPEGMAQMPVSSVWSFLFFFMIITLGLDSEFSQMEAVVSAITDVYPDRLRKRKSLLTAVVCFVCFLLGLPLVTAGGIYVLTLLDTFSGSYSLMALCITELVAVNWVYGFERFSLDIKMMIGFEPGLYWKATWMYISPSAVLFMLMMSAVKITKAKYDDYVFEPWAQGVGWTLVIIPITTIFITGAYQIFKNNRSIRKAIQPTDDWGPALEVNRVGRYASCQGVAAVAAEAAEAADLQTLNISSPIHSVSGRSLPKL